MLLHRAFTTYVSPESAQKWYQQGAVGDVDPVHWDGDDIARIVELPEAANLAEHYLDRYGMAPPATTKSQDESVVPDERFVAYLNGFSSGSITAAEALSPLCEAKLLLMGEADEPTHFRLSALIGGAQALHVDTQLNFIEDGDSIIPNNIIANSGWPELPAIYEYPVKFVRGGQNALKLELFVQRMVMQGWSCKNKNNIIQFTRPDSDSIFTAHMNSQHALVLNVEQGNINELVVEFYAQPLAQILRTFVGVILKREGQTITLPTQMDQVARELGFFPLRADLDSGRVDQDILARRIYRDANGRIYRVYADANGRRFHLMPEFDDKRKIWDLKIVQILSFARSPEWIFPEQWRLKFDGLLKQYSELRKIRIEYRTPNGNLSDGYKPLPDRYVLRTEKHFTLDQHHHALKNALAGLGLREVDGTGQTQFRIGDLEYTEPEQHESSVTLPVFSLADGTGRFVGILRPDHVINAAELVPIIQKAPEAKKVAILVTKEDHCLEDLLQNFQRGFLNGEITEIVSNRDEPKLRALAEKFGISFVVIESQGRSAAHKQELLHHLRHNENPDLKPDVVVLAKYMQILAPEFLDEFPDTINVHHGLLPSFPGPDPYNQATGRGVDVLGATGHFATKKIDSGALIAQEEVRTTRSTGTYLDRRAAGRQAEARVLTRSVQEFLSGRLIRINSRLAPIHNPEKLRGHEDVILSDVGLTVDRTNVLDDLLKRSEPGEIFLRQFGGNTEVAGIIKKEDVEKWVRDARAQNSLMVPGSVRRLRVMNATGVVFTVEL